MTENLTKADVEVLDKLAKERGGKNWKEYAIIGGQQHPVVIEIFERLAVLSRLATERRVLDEIGKLKGFKLLKWEGGSVKAYNRGKDFALIELKNRLGFCEKMVIKK